MKTRTLAPEVVDVVVDQVVGTLRGQLGTLALPPAEPRTPETLPRAFETIREAAGQADALRALLAGAAGIGARAALFVVKSGALEGWECAGFEDDPNLEPVRGRRVAADDPAADAFLASHRTVVCGSDSDVASLDFGQAERGESVLVPLTVLGRTAAALYADPFDPDADLDVHGLELLAQFTGLAVERLAAAGRSAQRATATGEHVAPAPAAAAAAREAHEPSAAPAAPFVSAAIPAAPATDSAPPHVQDARRFARLLMEEICLYHADKVDAGRGHRDLLARLGDELDRARQLYEQRVGADVRGLGDFFDEAMVKVLAGGDAGALGAPNA